MFHYHVGAVRGPACLKVDCLMNHYKQIFTTVVLMHVLGVYRISFKCTLIKSVILSNRVLWYTV